MRGDGGVLLSVRQATARRSPGAAAAWGDEAFHAPPLAHHDAETTQVAGASPSSADGGNSSGGDNDGSDGDGGWGSSSWTGSDSESTGRGDGSGSTGAGDGFGGSNSGDGVSDGAETHPPFSLEACVSSR